MQRVAKDLYEELDKNIDVSLLKWGRTQRWLPLILPYFFVAGIWRVYSRNVDIVYLQDGLLAPLGLAIKLLTGRKTVITIHGLDITYQNWLYQMLIPFSVSKIDEVVCISEATKKECIKREIPEKKISIIPNGVRDEFFINQPKEGLRRELQEEYDLELEEKKILLSVGRLVERKGFHWFIENLIPKLGDCMYIIVGSGELYDEINKLITKDGLEYKVHLLGDLPQIQLKKFYNIADLVVMPNISIEGDMEGFGLVAIEASSCGTPVVGSRTEGLKTSITEGKTGFLLDGETKDDFEKSMSNALALDRTEVRELTLKKYSIDQITKDYINLL